MSIGYDWLYPALSPSLRKRVATAIERWLRDFERAGFERQFPQGNYFAGYYAAKAYAGIALTGDTAGGAALLADWLRAHPEPARPALLRRQPRRRRLARGLELRPDRGPQHEPAGAGGAHRDSAST